MSFSNLRKNREKCDRCAKIKDREFEAECPQAGHSDSGGEKNGGETEKFRYLLGGQGGKTL